MMSPQRVRLSEDARRQRVLESQSSPLWIGLIVLVPLMLDHPVAADPHIWPRHLHPIQCNPLKETKRKRAEY